MSDFIYQLNFLFLSILCQEMKSYSTDPAFPSFFCLAITVFMVEMVAGLILKDVQKEIQSEVSILVWFYRSSVSVLPFANRSCKSYD